MTCRVPTERYLAQTEAGPEREPGREPRHGRLYGEGYPSGVSSEQTPTTTSDDTGPRPHRLAYAAALAALEGLALVAGGVWLLVLGLAGEPDDRGQAVTGGVTLIVLALLPLLAARGLFARRSWSRGPAVITQLMALPVAYNMLRSDGVAIPAGIVLAVVAVTALVLLINAETTRALGIRGPGNAGK
ncbi:hypothetical protein GCM10010297_04930 [Streptomyces malachitofuscus]|nr:hypothetical protein GCM10010297_04930 [Streptomyces malachitofuscus]